MHNNEIHQIFSPICFTIQVFQQMFLSLRKKTNFLLVQNILFPVRKEIIINSRQKKIVDSDFEIGETI